jgi:NADPH:quinone reductase-like Zn-dependent oxidoreductase
MDNNSEEREAQKTNTESLIVRTMKAVRIQAPGGPEQLVFEDAPMPVLNPGDALVRVFATGITPAELTWTETYSNPDGSPRIPSIPGHELSGTVEELPPEITDLKVGDAVYGLSAFNRDGAAAEYIAVAASSLAPKPKILDHIQSAAVPLSALTAWQAFFDHADLIKGQRVLIHGGSGGVGAFAIQLARWRGAYVITTASSSNTALLRGLGADEVIDYGKERFEDIAQDVDLVIDTIGGETLERSWKVLRPGGMLITLPGPIPNDTTRRNDVRAIFIIVEPNRYELTELARLIDAGELRPIISRVLPLDKAREAFELGRSTHAPGKIILNVAAQSGAVVA